MIINETIHNGDILRLIVHSVDVPLTSVDQNGNVYNSRPFTLRISNRDASYYIPSWLFTPELDGSLTLLLSNVPFRWSYNKGGYTHYVYSFASDHDTLVGEHPLDATGLPIEELEFYIPRPNSFYVKEVYEGGGEYGLTGPDGPDTLLSTNDMIAGQYTLSLDGDFGSVKCVNALTVNDDYYSHRILDVDIELVCDASTLNYGLAVAVTDYFIGISQARYYNYKTRITMTQTIQGAAPFQVPTDSFSISQSGQNYTIQCSVDYDWQNGGTGATWEDMKDVTAGDMFMASLMTPGLTYKLSGNTSTVTLKY